MDNVFLAKDYCPARCSVWESTKTTVKRNLQIPGLQHSARVKIYLRLDGDHVGLKFFKVWEVMLMFLLPNGHPPEVLLQNQDFQPQRLRSQKKSQRQLKSAY